MAKISSTFKQIPVPGIILCFRFSVQRNSFFYFLLTMPRKLASLSRLNKLFPVALPARSPHGDAKVNELRAG